MSHILQIVFQLKKFRIDEKGQTPIYARITLNHQRSEFSIKRSVEPIKWISNAGVAKGSSEEIKNLNAYLTTVKLKLHEHYRVMLDANKTITPETLKNAYFGIVEKGKTITEVFEYHNSQVKSLLGKDFAPGTYERYCTALKHVKDFIAWKYSITDLPVKDINYQFVTEFEFYLKTVRKCNHNSAIKYITNLKKITRICIGNGWLDKDPFINYKIRLQEVQKDPLTQAEIKAIADKTFATPRLEFVRDIFLFSCFTGLAYSDAKKLSNDHIVIGIDGHKWIKINRTKTETRSSIPVLPEAELLINKYANDPRSVAANKLLPMLSNQKMNAYLKEIADVCGINKNITFHLARHSFATTVMLSQGVPIETVSKMLGHSGIAITQHYAKVNDKKISDDIALLKNRTNDKLVLKAL